MAAINRYFATAWLALFLSSAATGIAEELRVLGPDGQPWHVVVGSDSATVYVRGQPFFLLQHVPERDTPTTRAFGTSRMARTGGELRTEWQMRISRQGGGIEWQETTYYLNGLGPKSTGWIALRQAPINIAPAVVYIGSVFVRQFTPQKALELLVQNPPEPIAPGRGTVFQLSRADYLLIAEAGPNGINAAMMLWTNGVELLCKDIHQSTSFRVNGVFNVGRQPFQCAAVANQFGVLVNLRYDPPAIIIDPTGNLGVPGIQPQGLDANAAPYLEPVTVQLRNSGALPLIAQLTSKAQRRVMQEVTIPPQAQQAVKIERDGYGGSIFSIMIAEAVVVPLFKDSSGSGGPVPTKVQQHFLGFVDVPGGVQLQNGSVLDLRNMLAGTPMDEINAPTQQPGIPSPDPVGDRLQQNLDAIQKGVDRSRSR